MNERTTTRFDRIRRTVSGALLPLLASTAAIGGTVALASTAKVADTSQLRQFSASDDAYTSSSRPTTPTGASARLSAGTLGGKTVTYLKFKVDNLPDGATVDQADLVLTRDEHHLPNKVQVAATGKSWSEKTITYRNAPKPGTLLDTERPTRNTARVTFDVSQAVNGEGTYAFAVTSPVSGDYARFRSTEYTKDRPVLRLTIVQAGAEPTPSTATPTEPAPADPTPSDPATTPSDPATTEPTPSDPATTEPTPTDPATSDPSPSGNGCTVDALLVPSCNILWGAAAGGFTDTPRDQALKDWEAKSGRTSTIYHTYHKGDELFPTKAEIAMASDPAHPRVLLLNWKVDYGTNWAAVARGEQDARIDRLAEYLKSTYTKKFFLAVHHEPENDVNPTPGSGKTAKDYAAMFRHTVERLRADGVTNAVTVVAFMGIEKFYNADWWYDLYPGDDVVDWIGGDLYLASQPNGYHYGFLADMVNRTTDKSKFPGFYNWATTQHPSKPIMLAEWGVHEYAADPTQKAKILSTVLRDLPNYPAIKGMVWFDTPHDQNNADIRIDSSPLSLAEFQKIAADPRFAVQIP